MLDRFRINKLFGTIDVDIRIDNNDGIIILVGENGLGKTTILNIIYNSLKGNFSKLSQFDFESLEFKFNNRKFILNHDDLKNYILYEHKRKIPKDILEDIIDSIPTSAFNKIEEKSRKNILDADFILSLPELRKSTFFRRYPSSVMISAIIQYFTEDLSGNLLDYKKAIEESTNNLEILHFPTYRRIEEDLTNLNIEIDEDNKRNTADKLIQFGMDDIKRRFQSIQDEIQKLSSIGLSRISSEILSQLIKGAPDVSKVNFDEIDKESVQIILARVGKALSEEDKIRIMEKINDRNIQEEDKFLLYFIQKLIDIYEEQRYLDNKIKTYINICNKYLVYSKKNIIYNESEVEFYIRSDYYKDDKLLIDFLNKLSSGEKQILSLFSKIYLTESNLQFLVLFDEPELSLSIYWQEILLPDIINSERCASLIAVTHSPFIYDNNLKDYAKSLNDYLMIGNENNEA